MLMHTSDSSQISAYGYDPERRLLRIVFRQSAQAWDYRDVPMEAFTAFIESPSKGAHFNRHIKGRYQAERVG